jgi:hypothetical protein
MTRKDLAHLVATLAPRAPHLNAGQVSAYALKLARIASSATRHSTNLCNIPNYQAIWDRKKVSLRKQAAEIAAEFRCSASVGGDPRGATVHLFADKGSPRLPGNTFGGDEAGYGI